jgi:eukaryotic-like serine/threonine-protein kinase
LPIVGCLALLLAGCGSAPEPPVNQERAVSEPPKITMFYPSEPAIRGSGSVNLCYGVENAAKVTIDPPVEQLSPSLSRCFSVSPRKTTIYTLTAESADGKTATGKATVEVGAAGPSFVDLEVSATEVPAGAPVSFCFKARNAAAVKGSPGRFQKNGDPSGDCLVDAPRRTTTYTITISGAGLSNTERLTVTVK